MFSRVRQFMAIEDCSDRGWRIEWMAETECDHVRCYVGRRQAARRSGRKGIISVSVFLLDTDERPDLLPSKTKDAAKRRSVA
jgi:hypothetical protein